MDVDKMICEIENNQITKITIEVFGQYRFVNVGDVLYESNILAMTNAYHIIAHTNGNYMPEKIYDLNKLFKLEDATFRIHFHKASFDTKMFKRLVGDISAINIVDLSIYKPLIWLPNTIIDIMSCNADIHELYLGCKVGDNGIRKICDLLKDNDQLVALKLSDNNITDIGAKYLSDMLKENNKITHLVLHTNNTTDIGAKYLSDMLMYNSSIEYIDITSNQITDLGASYFVESLRTNWKLEIFNMGCFGEEDKELIKNMEKIDSLLVPKKREERRLAYISGLKTKSARSSVNVDTNKN